MAKKDLHPAYHEEVNVTCICGNTFTVSAAVAGPIKVESCPKCHPIYTGKKETRVVKGRIEKFLEKQKRMDAMKKAA